MGRRSFLKTLSLLVVAPSQFDLPPDESVGLINSETTCDTFVPEKWAKEFVHILEENMEITRFTHYDFT